MFENDEISASTFDLYFNLLYSVYSIPNILLPFLGKRGHRPQLRRRLSPPLSRADRFRVVG